MKLTYGLISRLTNGRHILMWDFDEVELSTIEEELKTTQQLCGLSDIYIVNTSMSVEGDKRYSAVCFYDTNAFSAFDIVSDSRLIDTRFRAQSLSRGYFTIRIGPKNGQYPKLEKVLHSDKVCFDELAPKLQFVFYRPDKYGYYDDLPVNGELRLWMIDELREVLEIV